MTEYTDYCPKCGKQGYLEVISGKFRATGLTLHTDGSFMGDPHEYETEDEIVRCTECGETFPLALCQPWQYHKMTVVIDCECEENGTKIPAGTVILAGPPYDRAGRLCRTCFVESNDDVLIIEDVNLDENLVT